MPSKTNAQRQQDLRNRRKLEENRTEVRGIFAHPDDHQQIKDEAAKIARRRTRLAKRGAP